MKGIDHGNFSEFSKKNHSEDATAIAFARKCPKCDAWWTDKKAWYDSVQRIGAEEVKVIGSQPAIVNGLLTQTRVEYTIERGIYEHSCGGRMYDEGRDTGKCVVA